MTHPGLILIFSALLAIFFPQKISKYFLLFIAFLALIISLTLPYENSFLFSYLGYEINLIRLDGLSRIFLIIFSLMTFVGLIYALNQLSKVEIIAATIYAGSAMGAVLAGDLISFFIFWEIMAIGSTLVLFSSNYKESKNAAYRYLMIHLFGGVILMAGIAGHCITLGSITFDVFELNSVSSYLILFGFLINAAAFPFSSWLPDSYPEASFSGSVFLSAFTTKTAVYSLLRGYPGTELLIYVGLLMVFYGIIYALLENNMRRILSYSIVNQVGFMIVGAGIGTEMAINGASAHAFAHIIYKALLLMSAGSVLYMTGKHKCSELGGLFRTMPITLTCGIVGALAISAFPLTSGFVSKSMVSQAAADQHLLYVWLLLAAASAGVFLHAGIKFPWFVFFQKDSGLRPKDPPWNMCLAMIIFSFACVFIGISPSYLYSILPFDVNYVPYTGSHVIFQLQLLLFAGFAFFVMLPWLKRTLTISLDFDWFYRKLSHTIMNKLLYLFVILKKIIEIPPAVTKEKILSLSKIFEVLSSNWNTTKMLSATSILFISYLTLFYFFTH